MRSRSKGHAAVGVGCASLGAAATALGVADVALVGVLFAGTPVRALVFAVGGALLLLGILVLVFSLRAPPPAAGVVPAHVAFNSRMTVPSAVGAPRPAGVGVSGARAAAPAAPARAKGDAATLDEQIRDVTRRINKAGVLLATGQLSQQGYLVYVEELKKQLGQLEAQRVKAELQ